MTDNLSFFRKGRAVSAAVEVQRKLIDLGGGEDVPFKKKARAIRGVLVKVDPERWRDPKVQGRLKRFLHLEQRPKPEEVDDIRAAHALHSVNKIAANRGENEALFRNVQEFIERAQTADPDFFEPQIEALRQALGRLGSEADQSGGKT